jgi:hypothetical protein
MMRCSTTSQVAGLGGNYPETAVDRSILMIRDGLKDTRIGYLDFTVGSFHE